MKTIEELTKLGVDAAFSELQKTQQESNCITISEPAIFWDADKPAREAFARAVRDAVLDDQPAAGVPAWRPIAELPDDEREYVYWDGDGEMSWHGNPQEKVDATHFIAPPPKPDPFEAWWTEQAIGDKAIARIIWSAARDAHIIWSAAREAKA